MLAPIIIFTVKGIGIQKGWKSDQLIDEWVAFSTKHDSELTDELLNKWEAEVYLNCLHISGKQILLKYSLDVYVYMCVCVCVCSWAVRVN